MSRFLFAPTRHHSLLFLAILLAERAGTFSRNFHNVLSLGPRQASISPPFPFFLTLSIRVVLLYILRPSRTNQASLQAARVPSFNNDCSTRSGSFPYFTFQLESSTFALQILDSLVYIQYYPLHRLGACPSLQLR